MRKNKQYTCLIGVMFLLLVVCVTGCGADDSGQPSVTTSPYTTEPAPASDDAPAGTTDCGVDDAGQPPITTAPQTTEPASGSDNAPAELPENFEQIYREAESLYALFTGYGSIGYDSKVIEYNGQRYQGCSHRDFSSLVEMEAVISRYFSEEITSALMNKTVAGDDYPLYVEQDGKLYRFSGYAAQWGYDAAKDYTWTPLGAAGDEHLVEVSASITEYGTEYTATAVCKYVRNADGSICFTEFPLMIVRLWDAFAQPDQATVSTINDIADWDRLPWVHSLYGDDNREYAPAAYAFIHNLVSGESAVPEYNGLGIKDYSITLLTDTAYTSSLRFTFTVTGNSLPETLPPGTHTKIVYSGLDVILFDKETPEALMGYSTDFYLDEFGDNPAVKALHKYLAYMTNWEVSPFGEWDINSYFLPYNYICAFYGNNNMEIHFVEMQRLLAEKFGINIERPTDDCRLYFCEYCKERDMVWYADTRGIRENYRLIDVSFADRITSVTVQFYEDDLHLIPSYKVAYQIGPDETFLGCEVIDPGNYGHLQ